MSKRQWRLKPGLILQQQSNEAGVITDASAAQLYRANPSGYQLLTQLQHGASLNDLASHLHQTYQINLGQAQIDAQSTIKQLTTWNLVDAYEC